MDTTVGVPAGPGADVLGRLLDRRYRLDAVIAQGGMATVYLATDTRLDRTVAVKVMRPALAEDPSFVERFAAEARAAARLSSPDVVAVHDQGTDEQTRTAYLVMEHVAGRTLRDVVMEEGPLAPSRAVALLEPVLRALAAAHGAGLVHRDVKPENVLLGDDGRIKVADFGLARAVETSNLTRTTGLILGTVAYLAPEQVEHGRADTRTDVYAAGVLLFELLTGAPPYDSDNPITVAFRHVHEDVPRPSTLVDGIPAALDDLVVRATRRDPSARPVDAGAFLAELQVARADLRPDLPPAPRRTSPTLVVARPDIPRPDDLRAPGPSASVRRRRVVWVLVAALLAGLAVTGGWYAAIGRYTDTPAVLGLTLEEATVTLEEAGFQVALLPTVFAEQVPAGGVVDQDPDPGARVARGGEVSLVGSDGPDRRPVPSLVGFTREQATSALTDAGLLVGRVTEAFDARRPRGTVVSFSPSSGQLLRPGTEVALVLSKGPDLLPVPNVVGQALAASTQRLEKAGFGVKSSEVFSDRVAKGRVVRQDPGKGTAVRGATVALRVSKGPELIPVPDLRGSTAPQAEADLEALGLDALAC